MRAWFPGILMALSTLFGAAVPAFAHHGFTAEFDKTKCTDMHGTLTGIDWENPHAYVRLDVKDADGKVESWSLEMITPLAMKRNGTSREDFLANMGKPMAVRACPGKVGGTQYRGTAEFLKLSDGILRIVGQNMEALPPEQIHF